MWCQVARISIRARAQPKERDPFPTLNPPAHSGSRDH